MSGRITPTVLCFLTLVLWLSSVAVAADPSLVGWWPFDQTSGTVAVDASGNSNDGTISDNVTWAADAGYSRGAVLFDGTDTAHVEVSAADMSPSSGTFMVWGRLAEVQPSQTQYFFGHTTQPSYANRIQLYMDTDTTDLDLGLGDSHARDTDIVRLDTGQWCHVALTWDGGTYVVYLDGQSIASGSYTGLSEIREIVWIGNDGNPESQGTEGFAGHLDEARIYNRALSEDEIQVAMSTLFEYGMAYHPTPADGATDELRDVVLAWTAGELAQSHDVYFGTSFHDVNDADRDDPRDVLISQGQAATNYDLGTLDFETTYYWRVDEVNGAPDYGIIRGNVWEFSTELFAYPIENVIATTNAASTEGQGPENTVNGSGLNDNDEHSTDNTLMWTAASDGDETPYIQFEFDRLYKLHELLVWNHNMDFEFMLGIGLKDVTVQYSADGIDWLVMGDVQLAQATGTSNYTANSAVPLEGIPARFVRLVVNSMYGTYGRLGLSEVRFRYIPVSPREPEPADGTSGVDLQTALSWRSGFGATSHEVYLGTDAQAAVTGAAPVAVTTEVGYEPGILDLGSVYYWKVVEINADQDGEAWAGDIWSFSTDKYIEIDGFETYDDDLDAGTAIWQTWIDGLEDAGNGGSMVGNDPSPFAEQTIVHSGTQSMPLYYENTSSSAFSETDLDITPAQDWTASGIESLSLWFYGAEANTGTLYVKINDVKVIYDGEIQDIATAAWQPWSIDLSSSGANVSSVSTLSIGIEGTGVGVIYVDDVRLYPNAPKDLDLVAYYPLDGDVADNSVNGYDGLDNGDPVYVTGVLGQAIQLDGIDDYVAIADVGIAPSDARTIAGWAKADTTEVTAWTNVFGFTGPSGNNGHFDIECVGDGTYTTLGYYGLHRYGWERDIIPIDLEWHHLAATYDGTTVSWYGDGALIGSEDIAAEEIAPPGLVHIGNRADNTNFFAGSVDEVRIYDRALSAEELAGL